MMKTNLLIASVLLCAGAALSVTACSKSEPPAADKGSSAVSTAGDGEAKTVFETTCTPCHGSTGKGDGPAAAALTPKPRAYSDKAWQASVTDDQLKKVIKEGGAAVGKSASMPPLPPDTKPEVVDGLVRIVRGFGK